MRDRRHVCCGRYTAWVFGDDKPPESHQPWCIRIVLTGPDGGAFGLVERRGRGYAPHKIAVFELETALQKWVENPRTATHPTPTLASAFTDSTHCLLMDPSRQ